MTLPRLLLAAALTAALTPALLAAPAPAVAAGPLPVVSPVPQQLTRTSPDLPLPGTARIATGPATDPAALDAVRAALTAHGVRVTPDGALRVSVGPARDTDLPAGGYQVSTGRDGDTPVATLSGVDAAGQFYAAQTFRQLLTGHALAGVRVRDWPGMAVRGGEESFYGPGWSHEDQDRQMDFLAAHKANTFLYTPAADAHTDAAWRDPYPADELAQLAEVVARGQRQHVDFLYRIDPEAPLDPAAGICHADPADLATLVGRYEQLWTIGIHSIVVGWDDTSQTFR